MWQNRINWPRLARQPVPLRGNCIWRWRITVGGYAGYDYERAGTWLAECTASKGSGFGVVVDCDAGGFHTGSAGAGGYVCRGRRRRNAAINNSNICKQY
jgi:hypothetical protein